jgi:hypothetical protein
VVVEVVCLEMRYHALAVCGDAFCEDRIAQFTQAFFGVGRGAAFEEEDVEVRHSGVVCLVATWLAVVEGCESRIA